MADVYLYTGDSFTKIGTTEQTLKVSDKKQQDLTRLFRNFTGTFKVKLSWKAKLIFGRGKKRKYTYRTIKK